MKIAIKLPDKQTPGFLRRAMRATEFSDRIKAGPTPQLFKDMVEFLLPYVQEPEDRDAAREALWDASEEQFTELMSTIAGGSSTGNLPPESTTA